ncbi:hypothetical protein ACJMK2_033026 [Sinanodonta woodiana]|uniref:Neurotransmitter-gated ion-channel transmembrane domain-containing protein n=1 Tax=Sinanodonta woodiana TaxID=1069815 RepID=A0ABD3X3K0_SINWO
MHTILYVHFKLRRHMGYFLINVYVPCCLLVVLSWVSFWINREATSDRIALGTMTVLTMTFLGLESRNDLPRVSYTTALDVYIAMCFTFVLATMVQFAAVHSYTKHGYGEQMPDSPTTPDGEGDQEEQHQLLPPPKNRPSLMKRNIHGRRRFSRISIKRAASRVWRRLTMRRKRKKLEDERNSVSRIDKASRILFPLAFLIFNLLYSALYISLFL